MSKLLSLVFCFTLIANVAFAGEVIFDFFEEPEPVHLQDEVQIIEFGDKKRQYIWAPPLGLEGPFPTIFMLHGSGSSADSIQRNLFLEEFAHPLGIAVAYPVAYQTGWKDGRGGLPKPFLKNGTRRPAEGDVAFLNALFEQLIERKLVDENNIFISGLSTGGLMAMRMLCESSDKLNAVGTFLANLPARVVNQCNFKPGTPIMMVNSTKDDVMPFSGGPIMGDPRKGIVTSVQDTLIFFVNKNKCRFYIGTGKAVRNKRVRKTIYDECGLDGGVVRYRLLDWGHSVPGYYEDKYLEAHIRAMQDESKKKTDMVEELVNFFASHIQTVEELEKEKAAIEEQENKSEVKK